MPAVRLGTALALFALAAACTPEPRLPDLEQIYTRTAAVAGDDAQRRPLITVPGTLGSKLIDAQSGAIIWGGGGSAGISADPDDPREYALIALPVALGDEPFAELTDTVRPAGVLETAEADVLGISIDINVYGESLRLLAAGGFIVDRRPSGRDARDVLPPLNGNGAVLAAAAEPTDFDTFQFDYDWRRDLVESAHLFGRFLQVQRRAVATARGVPEAQVRFDLLAHSMGGMVTRYFLMYGFADPGEDPDAPLPPVTWAGAEFFDRVVFVAPPNGGSVIALDNLINGKELGPLQPVYPAAMLATHPAPYQLMPRARHDRVLMGGEPVQDLYDVALWQRMGWGLANPAAQAELAILMPDEPDPDVRLARGIAYTDRLLRRARTFHRMMDRWAPPPADLDLFLVVGGGFETPALAEIDAETGVFRITRTEEGDGVVLRASALLDERLDGDLSRGFRSPLRFKTTLFLPDEHVELTRNRVFGDNLLFWLLEAPRGGQRLAEPENAGLLANVAEGRRAPVRTPAPRRQPGNDR